MPKNSKLIALNESLRIPNSSLRIAFFRLDPLDINFNKGKEEGGNQGPCDQTDQSKSLDPSQHRKKEEQRMDIGSTADEGGSEKIIHHADHEYADAEQRIPFKTAPPINKRMAAGPQIRAVPPMGIKESRAIAVPQKTGEGRPRTQKDNPPKIP